MLGAGGVFTFSYISDEESCSHYLESSELSQMKHNQHRTVELAILLVIAGTKFAIFLVFKTAGAKEMIGYVYTNQFIASVKHKEQYIDGHTYLHSYIRTHRRRSWVISSLLNSHMVPVQSYCLATWQIVCYYSLRSTKVSVFG